LPGTPLSRRRLLGWCAGLAVLAMTGAPPAHARRRGRLRAFRLPNGAEPKGPVLTVDELRRCVEGETRIDAFRAELEAKQARADAGGREADELGAQLDRAKRGLDRTSKTQVASFNAGVDRQRKAVERYNKLVPDLNKAAADLNEEVGRFNAACAERPYYEDDMEAVRKAAAAGGGRG
jgi:hypothetical protein